MDQRDAKEQVVVQRALEPGAAPCCAAPRQFCCGRAGSGGGAESAGSRLQQFVVLQETGQGLDVIAARWQGGFGSDGDGNGFGIADRPAQEELELEPADTEEAVANRVEHVPGRRSVGLRAGRKQAQFLAQQGKRRGCRGSIHGDQQPHQVRKVASGRRSSR
jgi:hypothetical protein